MTHNFFLLKKITENFIITKKSFVTKHRVIPKKPGEKNTSGEVVIFHSA